MLKEDRVDLTAMLLYILTDAGPNLDGEPETRAMWAYSRAAVLETERDARRREAEEASARSTEEPDPAP